MGRAVHVLLLWIEFFEFTFKPDMCLFSHVELNTTLIQAEKAEEHWSIPRTTSVFSGILFPALLLYYKENLLRLFSAVMVISCKYRFCYAQTVKLWWSVTCQRDKRSFRDVGTIYIYIYIYIYIERERERSLFYLLMVKFWNTSPLSLRIFYGGSIKYF